MNLNIDPDLPYQSLHGHSTYSDGKMSYKEVLDNCEKNKIGVYAFTDHDFVPGEDELEELNDLNSHRVKYIIGTELSCNPPIGDKTIHMVGLFFDPTNHELKTYLLNQKEKRKVRFDKIIDNFEKTGFSINKDAYSKISHKDNLTLPDVKDIIFAEKKNKQKLLSEYEDFCKLKDHSEYEKQALKRINDKLNGWDKTTCIFYDLFMAENVRLSNHVEVLDRTNLVQACELIRNAGGISIFAHYTYGGVELGNERFEKLAKDRIFDGVETIYGMNEKDYNDKVFHDMGYMDEIANKFNLIKSGGADIHSLSDMEFFAATKKLSGSTTNLLQDILKTKDVNLKYSSLLK